MAVMRKLITLATTQLTSFLGFYGYLSLVGVWGAPREFYHQLYT